MLQDFDVRGYPSVSWVPSADGGMCAALWVHVLVGCQREHYEICSDSSSTPSAYNTPTCTLARVQGSDRVIASDARGHGWLAASARASTEIAGLSPGTYELLTIAGPLAPGRRVVEVPRGGHDLDGVMVVVESSGSIHGRIVDPRDRSIVGAFVVATRNGKRAGRSTHSSHDGSFVVFDLLPGDYTLQINNPGGWRLLSPDPLVTVRASEEATARLVVARERRLIRGHVQLRDGSPLPDVVVARRRRPRYRG